jgi:AAHS family 4-hydroxybenzoate transporter-like MFS transporter
MNFRRIAVLGLILLAFLVDGYDLAIMSFIAPAVAKDWNLRSDAMAGIFSAGVAGMLVGSLAMGAVADWRGRRSALLPSMTLSGLGLLACALTQDATSLAACRFVTGIGVGAVVPLALVLAEEYSPKRARARILALLLVGVSLGTSGLAGWLTSAMLPSHGWRWLLQFGGAASLSLAVILALFLPESVKFLFTRRPDSRALRRAARRLNPAIPARAAVRFIWPGEDPSPGRIPYRLLFAAERRWITPLLWTAMFCAQLTVYGLALWLPTLLSKSGFDSRAIALAATLFNISAALGPLAIARLIERWGAMVLVAFPLCGIPTVIALASAGANPWVFMPLIALGGASVGGTLQGLLVVAGQFYPTAIRGNAVGVAVFVSRFGSVLGPLLLGLLMAHGAGLADVFYACAAPLVVAAPTILALGRLQRRSRRP